MALQCRFEHFLWNPLCPQIQNTLHTIQPGPSKNRKPTRKKQKIFINSCWLQFYLVFWLPFPLVVEEGGKLSDSILAPGQEGEPAPTLILWLC